MQGVLLTSLTIALAAAAPPSSGVLLQASFVDGRGKGVRATFATTHFMHDVYGAFNTTPPIRRPT